VLPFVRFALLVFFEHLPQLIANLHSYGADWRRRTPIEALAHRFFDVLLLGFLNSGLYVR
jgi:hypothetical protein